MIYKEIKREDTFVFMTHLPTPEKLKEDYYELWQCEACSSEVPLKKYSDWRNTRHLCEVCATSTNVNEFAVQAANRAANAVLLALGHFDDVEIEFGCKEDE